MEGTSQHRNDVLDLLLEDVKANIGKIAEEFNPDDLQMELLNRFNITNQFCERLLGEIRQESQKEIHSLIVTGRAKEID